jgi:hypothetical protein
VFKLALSLLFFLVVEVDSEMSERNGTWNLQHLVQVLAEPIVVLVQVKVGVASLLIHHLLLG